MSIPIRHRLSLADTIANCTDIVDLHIIDAGSAAVKLSELPIQDPDGIGQFGPDFFLYDSAGTYLQFRTAASGGGTLLTVGVLGDGSTSDIYVSEKDNYLSTLLGVDVYSKITISNASYQSGSLYSTLKSPGDKASPQDLNNITNIIEEKAADFTVPELPGNKTYYVTVGASTLNARLPVWENNRNIEVTFIIADTGTGTLNILDDDGVTIIFQLWAGQGDHVTFKAGPAGWLNMTPKSWKYIRSSMIAAWETAAPGWKQQITSWTGVNNFDSHGVDLDWSAYTPLGAKRVKSQIQSTTATSKINVRAKEDPYIPNAPSDYYDIIAFYGPTDRTQIIELPFDANFITEVSARDSTSIDIYVGKPSAYYQ